MFIPLKMVLIGIDPYPYEIIQYILNIFFGVSCFCVSCASVPKIAEGLRLVRPLLSRLKQRAGSRCCRLAGYSQNWMMGQFAGNSYIWWQEPRKNNGFWLRCSLNPLSYGSNPPPFWVDASALKSEKSAASWDVGENQWRLALQIESNSLRSTSFAATGGVIIDPTTHLWCLMEICVSFHPGNEGTHRPRKHCFATWKQAAREDGPRWQHVVCCGVYGSGGKDTSQYHSTSNFSWPSATFNLFGCFTAHSDGTEL